jgi:hypothetical protein
MHLTLHNLLLQQAFGSVLSAGGKISTCGWWAVLAGQRCNTAGSSRDLEMQTKVGWVESSTFEFAAIWGYTGYFKKYVQTKH